MLSVRIASIASMSFGHYFRQTFFIENLAEFIRKPLKTFWEDSHNSSLSITWLLPNSQFVTYKFNWNGSGLDSEVPDWQVDGQPLWIELVSCVCGKQGFWTSIASFWVRKRHTYGQMIASRESNWRHLRNSIFWSESQVAVRMARHTIMFWLQTSNYSANSVVNQRDLQLTHRVIHYR